MKKFLLTLMSAAVVASVSAQPFHLISKDYVKFKMSLPEISGKATPIELGSKINTRVPESDLLGDWTFTMGDVFMEGATGEILDLPYAADLQPGDGFNFLLFQCAVEQPLFNEPPIAGIFNAETNELTITFINFGDMGDAYMFQYPGIYNWDTEDVEWQDIIGEYDPETGLLTFPEDAVIAWPAFSDPQGQNHLGWFGIYFLMEALQDGINGVEGILDDFNGEPVYYDLFGVKVDNPQKGQILIEKRGKNSRKVVF